MKCCLTKQTNNNNNNSLSYQACNDFASIIVFKTQFRSDIRELTHVSGSGTDKKILRRVYDWLILGAFFLTAFKNIVFSSDLKLQRLGDNHV